jgi:hypothetical protein
MPRHPITILVAEATALYVKASLRADDGDSDGYLLARGGVEALAQAIASIQEEPTIDVLLALHDQVAYANPSLNVRPLY